MGLQRRGHKPLSSTSSARRCMKEVHLPGTPHKLHRSRGARTVAKTSRLSAGFGHFAPPQSTRDSASNNRGLSPRLRRPMAPEVLLPPQQALPHFGIKLRGSSNTCIDSQSSPRQDEEQVDQAYWRRSGHTVRSVCLKEHITPGAKDTKLKPVFEQKLCWTAASFKAVIQNSECRLHFCARDNMLQSGLAWGFSVALFGALVGQLSTLPQLFF